MAKSLENRRPAGAASVSEFDRVFEAATMALVERIVESASPPATDCHAEPSDEATNEATERILDGLSQLVPRLLERRLSRTTLPQRPDASPRPSSTRTYQGACRDRQTLARVARRPTGARSLDVVPASDSCCVFFCARAPGRVSQARICADVFVWHRARSSDVCVARARRRRTPLLLVPRALDPQSPSHPNSQSCQRRGLLWRDGSVAF